MEEMVDILDEATGEETGEVISKDEAHKNGIWHGAIHILIVNTNKDKTLLQKRCEIKKLYPNTWDVAVGGHITTGEDDIESAKRELFEELGINLEDKHLEKIDRVKETLINNGIISNEFVTIFILYSDIDINDIKLQEEEVSDVRWFTKKELNTLLENNELLPHKKDYDILNSILSD